MKQSRNAARTATFVLGGILAVGGILGTGFAGAVAFATPDYSRMYVPIPAEVTDIEVRAQFSNIEVYDGTEADHGVSANVWASGSSAFGRMPQAHVEVHGTTATISIANEEDTLARGIGAATLRVFLGSDRLESLTVTGGSYNNVEAANVGRLTIDGGHGNTNLNLAGTGTADEVELTGSGSVDVITRPGDAWRIVKASWFDTYIADLQRNGYGTACAANSGGAPGICIDSDDTAQRTIDFSGMQQDSYISIRDHW